eukprot:365750-Chlamydomonas_euryale.AAC.1
MFGSAVLKGNPAAKAAAKPAGRWGKLSQNVDIAKTTQEAAVEGGYLPGDLSESDTSDTDLDNVTAVKLRARTPPWQRVEQCQWWVSSSAEHHWRSWSSLARLGTYHMHAAFLVSRSCTLYVPPNASRRPRITWQGWTVPEAEAKAESWQPGCAMGPG